MNKETRDVDSLLDIDGPPLHHLAVVALEPRGLPQAGHLLGGEEVAAGAVLPGVEVLGYLGAGFESDLSHVVQPVVTKQQDPTRSQHRTEISKHLNYKVTSWVLMSRLDCLPAGVCPGV